jgi:PAS domain S-box-containing protein
MWGVRDLSAIEVKQRIVESAMRQMVDPGLSLFTLDELYSDPQKETFQVLHLKDGRVFERYSKAQLVGEKCVGRVWSYRDITARKQAEEQLERLSNEYKAVLNSLGEGVHWLGRDGRIKFENAIATKMLGYEASELLGEPAHTIVHHTRADGTPYPIADCPVYATLKDGVIRHVKDEVFWRKDGTSFPVEYTSTPIHDENGRHAGAVVIFTDVTESRRAQAQIEENRQLLDSVLKNSVDGIVAYEAIRDKQGDLMDFRFLLINPAAERLLGRPAEEVVGLGLLDTFPDIVLDGLFEAFVRIITTGVTLDFEYSTVRSGDLRWYRVAGVKLGDGLVMSYSDITERKRSEAEMEKMHKQLLDTSRQAGMAEVATSVLHNVGNVLNSVNVSSSLVSNLVKKSKAANLSKVVAMLNDHAADLGAYLAADPKGKQLPAYLGQLAEHLVGEQSAVLKELNLLHENIEHIKEIVFMQQSYARISGVVETVKITDLVEDALRMNLGALQRHGVEVVREYEDIPPVDLEKHKVLQILVNLVRNAKYACDEGLRPDKQITMRVTQNNNRVQIAVIDNGVGIPEENLVRIFSHGFTTRKEGHGFGLHSAVLTAMELGGSLRVQSDGPGKGATFTLELPCKPHQNSAASETPTKTEGTNP